MLKLDQWFIERIELRAEMLNAQSVKKESLEVNNTIRPLFFLSKHNDEKYKVTIETVAEIKEANFVFKMKISGFFTIKDESKESIMENAPNMLLVAVQNVGNSILSKTIYPNIETPHFS